MPKPVKIVLGLLIGYALLVVAFESMIGILQPQQGNVLTITTTGEDGVPNDRVLARLDHGGRIYVSANHWPRAWYEEALANPKVEVKLDDAPAPYLAVPIDGPEADRVAEAHPHPFAFRFITGFPPRLFLRLDPRPMG